MSKNIVRSLCLAFLGCVASPAASVAGTGSCFLKSMITTGSAGATASSGTYGFTASGAATSKVGSMIPIGSIVQSGTFSIDLSKSTVLYDGNNNGRPWVYALVPFQIYQLDSNGAHSYNSIMFSMALYIDTCSGTFSAPFESTYSMVFVDGGDGVRISSMTPNLYLSFGEARKL